ncbi:MAG: hypothetical protein QXK76_01995 [Candidatus Woesearchaeota archaeon]
MYEVLVKINKGFEKLEPAKEKILSGNYCFLIKNFNTLEGLFEYIYFSQLSINVSLIVCRSNDISSMNIPSRIKELLPKTYRINSSNNLERVAKIFNEYVVDLKNPGFLVNLEFLNNEFFLTIDLSGDLSKRDYKIFNTAVSIKGTTAFGILMLSKYVKGKSLFNPFCNSGVIEIEAALYNNCISPKKYNTNFHFTNLNTHIDFKNFFKKLELKSKNNKTEIVASDPLLRNITAARKNAKIAGVEKYIQFRRLDIDWLDFKNKEENYDYIITFIAGSNNNDLKLKKFYDELFYQLEYILSDNGILSIACLSKNLLIESSNKYFNLINEEQIQTGEQKISILIFKKLKT